MKTTIAVLAAALAIPAFAADKPEKEKIVVTGQYVEPIAQIPGAPVPPKKAEERIVVTGQYVEPIAQVPGAPAPPKKAEERIVVTGSGRQFDMPSDHPAVPSAK